MKKLVFTKFNLDILKFFFTSIIIIGLIVWTLQSIKYFDFVTEDGHGLSVYFSYTILNFPKILHRILPFVFFISLFYTLINYELNEEINIYWLNGISKVYFVNKLLVFSVLLMIFQIILGSYFSPMSQLKGRNFLKNSNIDFFTSLIKEGKFINITKGLTIFIKEKNNDGTFNDIFLEDIVNDSSRMIYAKNGLLIDNENIKLFRLYKGRVINNSSSRINIFDFDQIDFNLKNLSSNTITMPKIQEIETKLLLGCFLKFKNVNSNFKCEQNLIKDMKQELLKRIVKPIYIPLITLLCCFLIIYSKKKINYKRNINFIFLITFVVLIISEATLRYSSLSNNLTIIYFLTPLMIFIFAYLIFLRMVRNA